MKSNTILYVPVLKAKRAEKNALQLISPSLRKYIVPLLEIVERKDKEVEAHLTTSFRGLADSMQFYPRCFLDARELELDGPAVSEEIFRKAAVEGINFTPVTGIHRTADITAVLKYQEQGIAIRLTRSDLEEGNLSVDLIGFMDRYGLQAKNVDMILDLGPVENMVKAGVSALANAFLSEVPEQEDWRTFIISGSGFPRSMGVVNKNSYVEAERIVWNMWKDYLFTKRESLKRLPIFSDCAIQHPVGVEGFDPRFMRVSASVRYAFDNYWLLMKGISTKDIAAKIQFPRLATFLVYGRLKSYYMGEDHCSGCTKIKEAADGEEGLGSPEVWRRLGTIHHITLVVNKLLSLLES